MEETKMFQKEADDKADGEERIGKKMAPSRLRRKAPKAPLKLDHNMYNPSAKPPTELSYAVDVSSRCAIPLLSPLIVGPPPPLPELQDNKVMESTSCPDHGGDGSSHNDKNKGAEPSSTPPPEGWKHPATSAPFTEPSSIFSFFQSQCYIAPHPTQ